MLCNLSLNDLLPVFFSQNPSNSSRLQRKQTHTTGRLQSIKPYRIEEMMQPVTAAIPRLHSKNSWSIINRLPNSTSCFTSFMQQLINLNVRAWHNYQLDAQPMEQCQILLNHTRWCQIKIRFNLSFIDSELKQPTSDLKLHIFLFYEAHVHNLKQIRAGCLIFWLTVLVA